MRLIVGASGFTLAEIMCAMVLIIILIIFSLSILPTTLAASRQVEYIQVATSIADEILETQLSENFDDIKTMSGTMDYTAVRNDKNVTTTYEYDLRVTSINAKLKNLTLTVSWMDGNKPRNLKIQTLTAKKE